MPDFYDDLIQAWPRRERQAPPPGFEAQVLARLAAGAKALPPFRPATWQVAALLVLGLGSSLMLWQRRQSEAAQAATAFQQEYGWQADADVAAPW